MVSSGLDANQMACMVKTKTEARQRRCVNNWAAQNQVQHKLKDEKGRRRRPHRHERLPRPDTALTQKDGKAAKASRQQRQSRMKGTTPHK